MPQQPPPQGKRIAEALKKGDANHLKQVLAAVRQETATSQSANAEKLPEEHRLTPLWDAYRSYNPPSGQWRLLTEAANKEMLEVFHQALVEEFETEAKSWLEAEKAALDKAPNLSQEQKNTFLKKAEKRITDDKQQKQKAYGQGLGELLQYNFDKKNLEILGWAAEKTHLEVAVADAATRIWNVEIFDYMRTLSPEKIDRAFATPANKISQAQLDEAIKAQPGPVLSLKELLTSQGFALNLDRYTLDIPEGKFTEVDLSDISLQSAKIKNLGGKDTLVKLHNSNLDKSFFEEKSLVNIKALEGGATASVKGSLGIVSKHVADQLTKDSMETNSLLEVNSQEMVAQTELMSRYQDTLGQQGVCAGLAVEQIRFIFRTLQKGKDQSKDAEYYQNLPEELHQKLQNPSEALIERIQFYWEVQPLFLTNEKQVDAAAIKEKGVAALPPDIDYLTLTWWSSADSGHATTVIRMRDDQGQPLGYYLYDPNAGMSPLLSEKEATHQLQVTQTRYSQPGKPVKWTDSLSVLKELNIIHDDPALYDKSSKNLWQLQEGLRTNNQALLDGLPANLSIKKLGYPVKANPLEWHKHFGSAIKYDHIEYASQLPELIKNADPKALAYIVEKTERFDVARNGEAILAFALMHQKLTPELAEALLKKSNAAFKDTMCAYILASQDWHPTPGLPSQNTPAPYQAITESLIAQGAMPNITEWNKDFWDKAFSLSDAGLETLLKQNVPSGKKGQTFLDLFCHPPSSDNYDFAQAFERISQLNVPLDTKAKPLSEIIQVSTPGQIKAIVEVFSSKELPLSALWSIVSALEREIPQLADEEEKTVYEEMKLQVESQLMNHPSIQDALSLLQASGAAEMNYQDRLMQAIELIVGDSDRFAYEDQVFFLQDSLAADKPSLHRILFDAVLTGNQEAIERLLPVTQIISDMDYELLLLAACKEGHWEAVEYLLEHYQDGRTGNLGAVGEALAREAAKISPDFFAQILSKLPACPLSIEAVMESSEIESKFEIAEHIVAYMQKAAEVSGDQRALSSLKNQLDAAALLAVTEIGASPPTEAQKAFLKACLERGDRNNVEGRGYALYAETAKQQNHELAQFLQDECKIGINEVDAKGRTALEIAVQEKAPLSVIEAFLKQGADPNIKSASGELPLQTTLNNMDAGLTLTLLKHGADAKDVKFPFFEERKPNLNEPPVSRKQECDRAVQIISVQNALLENLSDLPVFKGKNTPLDLALYHATTLHDLYGNGYFLGKNDQKCFEEAMQKNSALIEKALKKESNLMGLGENSCIRAYQWAMQTQNEPMLKWLVTSSIDGTSPILANTPIPKGVKEHMEKKVKVDIEQKVNGLLDVAMDAGIKKLFPKMANFGGPVMDAKGKEHKEAIKQCCKEALIKQSFITPAMEENLKNPALMLKLGQQLSDTLVERSENGGKISMKKPDEKVKEAITMAIEQNLTQTPQNLEKAPALEARVKQVKMSQEAARGV